MTDFATLQADLAAWTSRSDLGAQIPTCIRMCESDLRKNLRVRAMEAKADLTISSSEVAVPTGFLSARRLYLDSTTKSLEYLTPERLHESVASTEQGTPIAYTIEGDNFVFVPPPSETFTGKLLYWKAFTALSVTNTTNFILTNHYDVYLYGSLAHLYAFIEDDEQAAKWLNAHNQAVEQVNAYDLRSRHSGSTRRSSGGTNP